ncbi:IDEAL domain-containing protein [Metabacillus litoralis]|uniref:IDEAL domain-containing protein n=1 Tax=Metabacillus litoralis TaxID=152268 RepID=A0A5C6W1L3_9BACI|nr:IDEAL domain-containing protein [Metabacillus litoralis]TXC89669.1 IDEAL domain-containing protein [Metabacillus litoralis]
MKNKKSSYTEIMKSRNTMKNVPSEHPVLDMYIQMVVDEALFIRKKALLEERINDALDTKNKTVFMTLSKEYSVLRKLG